MKFQTQLEFPQFKGEALTQLPDDLFIPPEALEIYLEDFAGPMDVLLYLCTWLVMYLCMFCFVIY